MARTCGDVTVDAGRQGVPGAYGFFARYILMPWHSCLDVGGGLGIGLRILRRRSKRVRAIDQDPRLKALGVECGRVEDEPSGSVDWVLAIDVIEHTEDDRAFLAELWRVARRGIFLTAPNGDYRPGFVGPYHQREYSAHGFHALVQQVTSARRLLHFGGDICCGDLRLAHVSPRWEHQGIVALRTGGAGLVWMLKLRELALRLLRGR